MTGSRTPKQPFSTWRSGALLAASLCAVAVLAAYGVWQSRRSTLAAAEDQVAHLASTLEQYLRVKLRVVDRTLARAADLYRDSSAAPGGLDVGTYSRQLGLLEDLVPDTTGLRGSDETGLVVYGTSVPAGPPLSVASRQFFAEAARTDAMVLGLPLRSRVTGDWVMPAVRALRRADGSFGGVVYVNLDVDAIGRALRSAGTGVDGTIALFDADRRVYYRHPEPPSRKDEQVIRFQAPETLQVLAEGKQQAVYYTAQSSIDGRARLVAFRKVEGSPLYVLTSRSQAELLAEWKVRSILVAAFVLAFGVLALHFHREALRSWRAREGTLAALVEKDEELARSMRELERSKHSVEQASRAKSAFLASVSHEIRTPMNAIVGLTHLALRDTQSPSVRARLAGVSDAARHLLGLINDILDLSKIEAGKLELEDIEFDRDDLLSGALAMVTPAARGKGLELILDSGDLPERLRGDPKRLSQALINLLSNAVKFTDRGWVRLSTRVEARDDDRLRVRVEVQDTGPGVAPDRQHALFVPFEQGDSSTWRRHGGTGLGLALTRHLATAMGGEAGLESVPGRGSTFWFTATVQVGQSTATEWVQPGAGLRALVIDDVPASRSALAAGLAAWGVEVEVAASCAEGAALAAAALKRRAPFGLVLVDDDLVPQGHGPLRAALHQPDGTDTRFVLLGGAGAGGEAVPVAPAGFDTVLPRPASRTAVQDMLLRLLEPSAGPSSAATLADLGADRELQRLHAGKRVLLAEDNLVNQEVACELLRDAGLRVDIAATGAQAVTLARTRPYDLVLMDMQMPEMDGMNASRMIRAAGLTSLPIIAMTANAFEEDRQACLDAGMNDFVSKPVDPARLYARVLHWLSTPIEAG
jgi:signal transduction histidine kinase/DNA-binding response OmpR family regulator